MALTDTYTLYNGVKIPKSALVPGSLQTEMKLITPFWQL